VQGDWAVLEKASEYEVDRLVVKPNGGWGRFGSQPQSRAAPAAHGATTRDGRWEEDIDYFAQTLPFKEKDFYDLMPREKFEREVMDLRRRVPQLSDREILFGLMRITAGLGVGHTLVAHGTARGPMRLHSYGIEMRWFSDGLAVVAAAPEYREALGCRVVRLGSKTPAQAEEVVAPYIPHENDAYLHCHSPAYMTLAELAEHEKLAEPGGRLPLTCVSASGDGVYSGTCADKLGNIRPRIDQRCGCPACSHQFRPQTRRCLLLVRLPGSEPDPVCSI
jgi:hypothetical protein